MRELVLWTLSGVAVAAGAWLLIYLLRQLRAKRYKWDLPAVLTALGLVATVVLGIVPHLFADDDEPPPDPAVVAYQREVAAACAALGATGNPVLEVMGSDLNVDRERLKQSLGNQLAGRYGVLQELWTTAPPESLTDEAETAREDGNAWLPAMSAIIGDVSTDLPASIPDTQVFAWLGGVDARLRPFISRFDASMSNLAGASCSPPPNVPENGG